MRIKNEKLRIKNYEPRVGNLRKAILNSAFLILNLLSFSVAEAQLPGYPPGGTISIGIQTSPPYDITPTNIHATIVNSFNNIGLGRDPNVYAALSNKVDSATFDASTNALWETVGEAVFHETDPAAMPVIDAHRNNFQNPHRVTAAQVGAPDFAALDAAVEASKAGLVAKSGDTMTGGLTNSSEIVTLGDAGKDLKISRNQLLTRVRRGSDQTWHNTITFDIDEVRFHKEIRAIHPVWVPEIKSYPGSYYRIAVTNGTLVADDGSRWKMNGADIATLGDIPPPIDASNMMTLDTAQTVTADKTFVRGITAGVSQNEESVFYGGVSSYSHGNTDSEDAVMFRGKTIKLFYNMLDGESSVEYEWPQYRHGAVNGDIIATTNMVAKMLPDTSNFITPDTIFDGIQLRDQSNPNEIFTLTITNGAPKWVSRTIQ